MPDVIITPNSGLIEFRPSSTTVNKIEASGNTFNLVNTANPSGAIFNIEATNGSLFSVVDNLNGTLMSVNNNAGLPVLEVFSDDKIVGGRFGQNDFIVSSSGNVGIGKIPDNNYKLDVNGKLNLYNSTSLSNSQIYAEDVNGYLYIDSNTEVNINSTFLYINSNAQTNGSFTATSFTGAGSGLTGTAASLTAGSVTTNANLTGDVTSVGNATSIAAGVIVNADINASAAIADTKLATISTAGKVANSATTATNANTASAIVSRDASGNFSAGTITATLSGNASTVTNGVYTTGDQSVGGVKTFTSQIINTTANNGNTGGGQIYLNGANGNRIDFNGNGTAAPSFTTRSAGTKITLFPNVGASSADYAIGIEAGGLWQSVSINTNRFKWYAGTTNIATLEGGGQLTLSSNAGYTTPTLTLLNDSTTDGSFRFFPMPDGAGGYVTFNSSANTTTNGILVGGTSTMTGYHASRRQGAFQWVAGTSDSTSRFEFLTANGGTTAQTMTSRMSITAQGRVGIGLTTPGYPLEVNGTISLNATTVNHTILLDPENPSIVLTNSNADTVCSIDDTSTHFFGDSNADGLYFDKIDIRVGIKTQSPSHELHVAGNILCDKLYLEKSSSPTISSNTLTINLSNSQLFLVSLNSNITTLTISNTPATSNITVGFTIIFTADGTARSVTWPGSVKWAGGTAPTLTSTNAKRDVLSFVSTDNGTTWLGFVGGQNY